MIYINNWYGRLSNNILQIVRAIYFCQKKNHNLVQFNNHKYLKDNKIKLNNISDTSDNVIKDTFFNLKKYNICDPEPYKMKEICLKYIKPLLKFNFDSNDNLNNLYIHFRGGDVFSLKPHNAYVQPPLFYYKKIILENNYNKILLVCEDTKNPCINELLKLKNTEFISNINVEDDINILLKSTNFALCFSTFGYIIYLLNENLENIYIPQYFLNELLKYFIKFIYY